jgi:DNA invertase Pin-like site-specific DNA recombinase
MIRASVRPRPFIAYYRVSTRRQGASGLGLEAQRECVECIVRQRGGRVAGTFREVESGARADRPELARALDAARAHGATLIVAKLDRLARNAAFLLSLRDAGVDILACDLPDVNRMVVGIMALVAEEEAHLISERTRAALAAAKRRGTKLGTPANLTARARRKGSRAGAAARGAQANARALELRSTIRELRAGGAVSLRDFARGLNERGIPTPRGGGWGETQAQRLLARLEAAGE